ncbi:MAG: hypothetical protein U0Z75_10505 [Deinococcaceae bacterium]
MNTENEVKQGLMIRQTRILLLGILGVGATGVTAYLMMSSDQNASASKGNLVSVANPTVRTQAPIKVPEVPFLVEKASVKTGQGVPKNPDPSLTSTKDPSEAPSTTTSGGSSINNPFRPFRLTPKQASGSTGSGSVVVTPPVVTTTPPKIVSVKPIKTTTTPVVVRPTQVSKTNTAVSRPTSTTVVSPPKSVTTVIRVIPKPVLSIPDSALSTQLPENLSQKTLSAIPPVLRQTLSPRSVALPVDQIPVQVPGDSSEVGNVPLDLPMDSADNASRGQVGMSNFDLPVLTLGDKVRPDAAPALSPLKQWVMDRDWVFSSVVLGPINTAVFRNKTGFSVVQLGQKLPNSDIVVQSISAGQVVLQLGDDKLELNLDRR